MTIEYLKNQWEDTMTLLHVHDQCYDQFDSLIKEYSQSHRYYHNISHLEQGFKVLNEFFVGEKNLGLIKYAFFFHDFWYNVDQQNNEECSAVLAYVAGNTRLHLKQQTLVIIQQLIMATEHKIPPQKRLEKIIVDVDLSILGCERKIFDEYNTNIRREYQHIDNEIYRTNRTIVLQKFLRNPVFNTPELINSEYETRAYENIKRTLEELKHG